MLAVAFTYAATAPAIARAGAAAHPARPWEDTRRHRGDVQLGVRGFVVPRSHHAYAVSGYVTDLPAATGVDLNPYVEVIVSSRLSVGVSSHGMRGLRGADDEDRATAYNVMLRFTGRLRTGALVGYGYAAFGFTRMLGLDGEDAAPHTDGFVVSAGIGLNYDVVGPVYVSAEVGAGHATRTGRARTGASVDDTTNAWEIGTGVGWYL